MWQKNLASFPIRRLWDQGLKVVANQPHFFVQKKKKPTSLLGPALNMIWAPNKRNKEKRRFCGGGAAAVWKKQNWSDTPGNQRRQSSSVVHRQTVFTLYLYKPPPRFTRLLTPQIHQLCFFCTSHKIYIYIYILPTHVFIG